VCSIVNSSQESFEYLVARGVDLEELVCPLCKTKLGRRSLLEFMVINNQYNKSAWFLKNYPEASDQINGELINELELEHGPAKNRLDGFWSTVQLVREAGHEVNLTRMQRESH